MGYCGGFSELPFPGNKVAGPRTPPHQAVHLSAERKWIRRPRVLGLTKSGAQPGNTQNVPEDKEKLRGFMAKSAFLRRIRPVFLAPRRSSST